MFTKSLVAVLALVPVLVSAGLFPPKGPVKVIDDPTFRKIMKEEKTSMVVFFAPWCGHCKSLTPEYIKAAKSLAPLVPFYAIDCDADKNKRLCSEQGVKGFPTIKSFPRGTKSIAHDYNGERKAAPIAEYMTGEVPNRVATLKGKEAVTKWTKKETSIPRALLLTAKPRSPLLWKVLQNKFNKKINFGASKDENGSLAKTLGVGTSTDSGSKVLVWTGDSEEPVVYEGALKFEPLLEYFNKVVSSETKAKDEL